MKLFAPAAIAVLAPLCLCGQTFETFPSFEVTSVKRLPDASRIPDAFWAGRRRSGGRITWTTSRNALVSYAYHLPVWRIAGLQPDESYYAIEATMDASATEDQVRLMFRRLLAERFQFTANQETREIQGFLLAAGRNGPKVQSNPASGEAPPMPEYLRGKPPAAFQGQIFISMEGKGISALTARGVPLSRLAETLSDFLGTFVIDKTGVSGDYYFGFKFLRDNAPPDADAPTLAMALQEELGLRLEKQKGPVEVLVVTHVEKLPAEN